jgi:hemolysin III
MRVLDAPLSPSKPRLRGWFHEVAFFVSIPAGVTLAVLAAGAKAKTAAIVYAVSLTAVFGASAAYHRVNWSPKALRRMKRLDHSMIFVLIAGSYTPICLLALHGAWGIVLLSIVWSGAVVGITVKLIRIDGFHVLSGFLYIALGWVAIFALPALWHGLSPAALVLMIAGGVLYTLGAIVLARRRPDPKPELFGYHEVWHAFMVAAVACHYAMIMIVVRAGV